MERDDYLNGLIGDWTLTGTMGSIALTQSVTAKWILADSFVEMKFHQTDADANSDRPPYEALYLIGVEPGGTYIFHLFDSFGVSKDYRCGVGHREGNRIEFVFPYVTGTFYNTLEQGDDAWTWRLESVEGDKRKLFATKHMTRFPSA